MNNCMVPEQISYFATFISLNTFRTIPAEFQRPSFNIATEIHLDCAICDCTSQAQDHFEDISICYAIVKSYFV